MSEISDFADRYIFPLVYERADQIFPEFEFKRGGKHWVSGNDLKVDGSRGEKHKVYIYADRPYYLKDYTRKGKAITTYLKENYGFPDWIDAITYLADKVGVPLPEGNLSEEAIEAIKKKEKQTELFETINDFFVTSLLEEKGRGAEEVRKYLSDRGYAAYLPKTHDETHTSNKMELGFFPSREKLKEYLKSKGIESEVIENLFKKDEGCFSMMSLGSTHQLTIPYRDHSGRIIGFAFRNINHKKTDTIGKYLYSSGLRKKETLFKLSRIKNERKELILVEGYLDVMLLKSEGIDNVAALGGISLNTEQVKLAKQMGTESITLWLDRDKTGVSSTDLAIDVINKSDTGIKVYVVEIPNEFIAKDPDELIHKYGIDTYHEIIKEARSWYIYHLDKILNQVDSSITDKDRDHHLNEINKLGRQLYINNPVDIEAFFTHLAKRGPVLGVSVETLLKVMDKVKHEAERDRLTSDIFEGIKKAVAHIDSGEIPEGLELLGNISKQGNIASLESSYEKLLTPITEDILRENLKSKPDHLNSGLRMGGEELLFPSGAITIVAAPTNHGKTTFLINTALNTARDTTIIQSDKRIYLFTYEESADAILVKALNTYINKDLSHNNRRSIESCIKEDTDKYINQEHKAPFLDEKKRFFDDLIKTGRLNIIYSDLTLDDLIGAIHYLYKHGNPGIIFIDYIQLLKLKKNRTNSRHEEMKQVCLDLKDCAIETGLPIVLGAQFNREVISKELLHPTNIGEAGDIERIANLIIGLWNNRFPPLGNEKHVPEDSIYAKILKGRDIPAGAEESFYFNGNRGKIGNKGLSAVKKHFGS